MLRTERLVLRPWRDTDLAPFRAINSDPSVMEHLPGTLTGAESDALAVRLGEAIRSRGFGLWAVEVCGPPPAGAGASFVGFVGLHPPELQTSFTPCVEVGWRLARDVWGRGYATEAARAAIDDGFTRLGLDEVLSWTVPANTRSRRVMERLGMQSSPRDDFDHPLLPQGHPLWRHVLYRIRRGARL